MKHNVEKEILCSRHSEQEANTMTYIVEKLSSINLEKFDQFFNNLPADPYIKDKYRFRRLSRFKVQSDQLIKLSHQHFFQSKQYNSLLGEVKRDYSELDDGIIKLDDFRNLVLSFIAICKLDTQREINVNVHQLRIICSPKVCGEPVPEGIHKDAVDFVGIFAVKRENIQDGKTCLYKSKNEDPVFCKIIHPKELLVFNDQEFFHFTTPIKPVLEKSGLRDVFVLTFPAWEKASEKSYT